MNNSSRRPNPHSRRTPGLGHRAHSLGRVPAALVSGRGILAVAFALVFVVALPARGSFGSQGFGAAPQRHVLATPAQPSHAPVALGLRLRATKLTRAIESLSVGAKVRKANEAVLARKLTALSRARQRDMLRLLAQDPQAVRSLILPRKSRVLLRRLGIKVEMSLRVAGRYRTWHSDDFKNSSGDVYLDQLVSLNGKNVFTLHGATSAVATRLTFARLKPNAPIAVQGFKLGGQVLATKVSTPGGRSLASATATATTGPLTTAVIAVNFSDSATPVDMNAIRTNFEGNPGHDATSFFAQASYGKMSLAPSFFGPYTLATSSATGCSTFPIQDLLSAANADVDYTQFKRFIYVFNCAGVTSFGYATSEGPVATPDGTVTAAVITLDNSSAADLFSVVHEISHTLGSFNSHAALYVCQPEAFMPTTRFDTGCMSGEYGDSFDVLGGGSGHTISQLDPIHKAKAGWFDPGQFPTVTTSGTYTLAPYEQGTSGALALNIPRGQSGTAFTVEYRQPIGFDSWMGSSADCHACTVTQGASLRLAATVGGGGGGSDTQLIDTTPGSIASSLYYPVEDGLDAALLPGHTFTDPEFGIAITVLSASSSGLAVQVTIPAQTCVRGTPTVSSPSPAAQTGGVGQTVTSAVTLTNTDSSGCPTNTFRYMPPSNPFARIVASPDFLTLAPGASATISLAVSPTPLATAGTYSFSAIDGVGAGRVFSNSLGTSAAVISGLTYQLNAATDSMVPSAPANLAATALGSSAVKLSWSAASDNVGVIGYQITRNSNLFTTGGTSFIDSGPAPGATNSYSVRAFDRQGNLSTASTVSVTTPARSDSTAPTSPVVTAGAGDHSLSVSWSASTDNVGVAYYRISPCLVPGCIVPASAHSFTAVGLPTRTRYDLQVLAVDGDGNTSNTFQGAYTVYTAAGGTTAPTQPTQLVSTSGRYGEADLSWAPSSDDKGVVGYDVYRNNRKIATVSTPSFVDNNVIAAHEYYVQAVDGDGSLSAPTPRVWFLVPNSSSSDSSPPTASVSAPTDGATVSGTVAVAAAASDDVGVRKVEFYVDGVLQTTSTSAPYSFSWDTTKLADGPHWLFMRAYDAATNYGTAGVTNVNVRNNAGDTTPPAVAIAAPTAGATVTGLVSVSATASDDVGVTKIDLSVDGALKATLTAEPWSFGLDTSILTTGSHALSVKAYDSAGNNSSAEVTINVAAAADTSPPSVSIVAPVVGATVSGTTQVQTGASDNVGVTKVELTVDGALNSTLTAAPWNFDLTTTSLANGNHTLAVKAYDAAGNSSSAQVSVNVQNAIADATAPKAPSSLRAAVVGNTQVALYWTPSTDNVGVVGYEVTRDGVVVGNSLLPNYLDSGLLPGTSHVYSVRALDAAGNRSTASSNLNSKTAALSTSTTGTIAGVVYNALGRPSANVVVQLTGNGLTKTAKTSTSGVYKFTSLPPGSYTLTITPPAGTSASASLTTDLNASTPASTVVAGQTTVLVSGP